MTNIDWLEESDNGRVRKREFTLHHAGRTVPGAFWQPSGGGASHAPGAPRAPMVCLGHGASGDRHQPPLPFLVRHLVGGEGFFALAIDGPVHGRRLRGDGGRVAFFEEWGRPGNVDDMTADWKLAIDTMRALPEVGDGPLGYWGLSMGTIYGAPLVAAEPRIRVAVLGLMGIAGPTAYRAALKEAAASITCPILFLQQLEDELFSREKCVQLFDAFASTDKRLHANPGLHIQVPLDELRTSVAFLARYLNDEVARLHSAAVVAD